jgi:hypothetical protein
MADDQSTSGSAGNTTGSSTYNVFVGSNGDPLWTPNSPRTVSGINVRPGTTSEELAEAVAKALGRQFGLTDAEVAEKIRSGSMGGKDPEARQEPVRRLVRTFGKWANGRFTKCVRVLSKKPHLVARGGGNVNRLCAWLKDQWLGTTSWRKSRARDIALIKAKKAASAAEAMELLEAGNTILLPSWMPDEEGFDVFCNELSDFLEAEMERETKEGYDPGMERDAPSVYDDIADPGFAWDDPDDDGTDGDDMEAWEAAAMAKQVELLKKAAEEGGCGCSGDESAEAASQERIKERLHAALREKYKKNDPLYANSGYCYIRETFNDHVIFEFDRHGDAHGPELYRQFYSVDSAGQVVLNGEAERVEIEYKKAETSESSATAETPAKDEASTTDDEVPSASDDSAPNPTDDSVEEPGAVDSGADSADSADDSSDESPEGQGARVDSEQDDRSQGSPKGFTWVIVKNGNRSMPALVEDKSGRIIRGPRSILGKKLPPIPRVSEAASEQTAKLAATGSVNNFGDCLKKQIRAGKSFVEARKACIDAATSGRKSPEEAGTEATRAPSTSTSTSNQSTRAPSPPGVEIYAARLSAEERKRSAVIVRTKPDGSKEYKFPIPDVNHARLALAMINQSDLTEEEKKKVRRRALEVLGKAGRKGSNAKEDEGQVEAPPEGEAEGSVSEELETEDPPDGDVVQVAEDGGAEVTVDEMVPMEGLVSIAESKTAPSKPKTPSGKDVDAIIRVIVPGPGNPADRFYYPGDVIRRDIKVLAEGKKMYKDHLTPEEEKKLGGRTRSVDDWAAVIEEAWADDTGTGYGGVTFVDEAFHQKAKKGHAHLGVSIRARAIAKPGRVDGKDYRVVESFIQGRSVDFVTEAGAGGGFVSVAESHKEETMAKFEGTLDDLMQDRPDLLDQFRAQVEAETIEALSNQGVTVPGTEATESQAEGETSETVPVTREELEKMLTEAREAAVAEVREMQKVEDLKRDQRAELDRMLAASGLRPASQKTIRAEMYDAVYEAETSEDGSETKSQMDVFKEKAAELIEAKKEEISEYIQASARVRGLGPAAPATDGKSDEAETKEGGVTKRPRWSPNAEIDKLIAEPMPAETAGAKS